VDELAERFETHRVHLRTVAYRMLGSLAEADDAVQESWLRLSRSDTDDVANLRGWLTTVVGRIALDMLRSRAARREEPLETRLPDPVVTAVDGVDPEHSAVLADSVGLALLVVLDTLSPTERLVFVLHDMFAVPFDEIARIVDRSPAAAKQLASRARRRVQGRNPDAVEPDVARQREVVAAFLAASRGGSLDALLAVLAPDVVLRVDTGEGLHVLHGASAVAGQALTFARFAPAARHALVNGAAGVVNLVDGRPVSVMGMTVHHGRIVRIDILADPDRLTRLGLPAGPAGTG
jgi:RNA polymerase sigma factor (sigma-70 family)